jgi:hypothetical protein
MSIPQPRSPGQRGGGHPHPGGKPPNRSCMVILVPMLLVLSGIGALLSYGAYTLIT